MGSELRSEVAKGCRYAILGSVCAGSVPTLTKALLVDNGPVVVTGFSMLLSGLFLVLYQPRKRPPLKSLPYIVFFGLVGAALAPLMFTLGLDETTAVNASLLANGEVLFTTIIAFAVFGERLSKGQAGRGMLIVAGLAVVSTNLNLAHVQFLQDLEGNLLVLGATLGWGVENNLLATVGKRFDTTVLSKFRNIVGGAAITGAVFAAQLSFGFDPANTATLFLLGAALAGATTLFIAAVKRLGAIRMLLVWSSATVFGAVFALVFLGEEITLPQGAGGVLILLGVFLFHRGEAIPEAEPFSPPAGVAA